MSRTLVIIPTYDERENLEALVGRVLVAVPAADLLVVDDNSPDGTGELADRLAVKDPRVHVVHRPWKNGLGSAYREGFAWGLSKGFDVLVEMDGDGSHQPEQLHRLLDRMASADLVIGSRWVPGGAAPHWPLHRVLLSRAGSLYARLALGLPFHDVTGGYRAFTAEALASVGLDTVTSQGYCFQIDMLFRAHRAGLAIAEVPITFVERLNGVSKMNSSIVREAVIRVTVWGLRGLPSRLRSFFLTPSRPIVQRDHASVG